MTISNLGILQTPTEESTAPKKTGSRRRPKFRTQLFGYDKSEVRSFIARLQSDVEQSREWADSVARDLEQSRRTQESQSGTPSPDKPANPQKAVAHLVERTLTSTHRLADEIRQEARKEADEIIADARTRAARIIEEATATAGDTHEHALLRLKEVEQHIGLMKERHRDVVCSLESMVSALGRGLNDMRSHYAQEETSSTQTDTESAREVKEPVHENVEAAGENVTVAATAPILREFVRAR
jgi:cell division septum initiation protein DivIVA